MEPKTEIAHITTPVAKYTLDFNTGVIKAKPIITRGDSIRSMTDEELAAAICKIEQMTAKQGHRGFHAWLDWLKEEVKR